MESQLTVARGSRLACGDDWRGEAVVKAEKAHSAMKMLAAACRRVTGAENFI